MMRRYYESYIQRDSGAQRQMVEERAQALAKASKGKADSSELMAAKREAEHHKSALEALRQRVSEFEAKSGISVDGWDAANVGELVRALQNGANHSTIKGQLIGARDAATRIAKSMTGALKNLDELNPPTIK
jgi:hypothetical protein